MNKTVILPAQEIPVIDQVDVLVVGGGPAGVSAAVCAARKGAHTMLVDRYGYLGGLVTGAMVILLDDMYHEDQITVAGIVSELQDRLQSLGGLIRPEKEDIFQTIPELYKKWNWWGLVEGWGNKEIAPVVYRSSFDVEICKQVLFQMVEEAHVKLRLHSWCTAAITEDNQVKGAIFFSKSGYQAVEARIVIDTTGDGDVFSSAGAEFAHGEYLISTPHFISNVDTEKVRKFFEEEPDAARELDRQVRQIYGASWNRWFYPTINPGVVWCDCPHFTGFDAINVEHLTHLEIEGRKRAWEVLEFVRKNYPGFEKANILHTACQIGIRQSRLLKGEYILTVDDIRSHTRFEDRVGRGGGYTYPYRSLLPRKIDNLLVAGRHFSADPIAQRAAREWPPCMVTGQAAGTAAALAISRNVKARDVDISELQRTLLEQGVLL
jgi:hypothetical protein